MKTSIISLEILANSLKTLPENANSTKAKAQESPTAPLAVNFEQPNSFDLGETKVIHFTFSGMPTRFELLDPPFGWVVSLAKVSEYGGSIAITASKFSLDTQSTLDFVISNHEVSAKNSVKLSLSLYTIAVGAVCHENGKPVGVVFRPKTKHQAGLIVHKKNTSAKWGNAAHTYAIDRDNGLNNAAIIGTIDETLNKFPSFGWCCGHGRDWYMPSIHELIYLFYSKAEVNSSLYEISGSPLVTDGAAYWASNEVNDRFAWSLYFQDGHLNYHKKEYNKLVRAIRSF